MRSHRAVRTVTVLATAALVAGAFTAGTADAAKKKKKPPAAPVCPAYTPSEWSADLPVTTITDAHTADAPLEITVPTEAGVGTSSSDSPENGTGSAAAHAFVNVQIDSAAAETGLYGSIEFTPAWDYDLYFRGNDGVGLAYSAGTSHLIPAEGWNGTGTGGHSDLGSENIDGLVTPDCTGYLVDVIASLSPGEDVTLKLWLGEPAYTPSS